MLISKDFVFIHFTHSGGSFIREVLSKHQINKNIPLREWHTPISKLPQEHRKKLKFGNIRNPWSFYYSLYRICLKEKHPITMSLNMDSSWTFELFLNKLLDRDFAEIMRDTKQITPGNPRIERMSYFSPMADLDFGYYSMMYTYMFFNNWDYIKNSSYEYIYENYNSLISVDAFVKQSNLKEDLIALLSAFLSSVDKKKIMGHGIVNSRSDANVSWKSQYTTQLVDLVSYKERLPIEKHNFVFEK